MSERKKKPLRYQANREALRTRSKPEHTLIEKLQSISNNNSKNNQPHQNKTVELTEEEYKIYEKIQFTEIDSNNGKSTLPGTNIPFNGVPINKGSSSTTNINQPPVKEEYGILKFLDYTMYVIPLSSFHLLIDYFVYKQYTEEVNFTELVEHLIKAVIGKQIFHTSLHRKETKTNLNAIVLYLIMYFIHPYVNNRHVKNLFTCISTWIGCYVIWCANNEGYYATMQKIPPMGTLWVYIFFDLEWYMAAFSLFMVGLWTWFHGYSLNAR